jgi:paraquat-inducible protein A
MTGRSGLVAEPVSAPTTHARLHECSDCGQFQSVPPLPPASTVACLRCDAVLRRTRHDPFGVPLALYCAALALLLITAGTPMMSVSRSGLHHEADLFSGPIGLQEHGMWPLAALVLFTTIGAPLVTVSGNIYVLLGLRMRNPPRHLRAVFGMLTHLRPWSMIEVYLLGVFVAYTKLGALVRIDIGIGLYALAALLLTMIVADAMSDPQAVWDAMDRRGLTRWRAAEPGPDAIGCHTCGLVGRPVAGGRCRRCYSRLHVRKPESVARTWALLIAASVLYIPANVYPVLSVVQLGAGEPSTILGGAKELLDSGLWPLAALVFFASVAVPMLKLVGLSVLLIGVQRGWTSHLRDRTVLYRIVRWIGRWSMIDIFMESILVALVQFGGLVTIDPGGGAVAFAGVVVLTMFAAESFDPRLTWDAAGERSRLIGPGVVAGGGTPVRAPHRTQDARDGGYGGVTA